MPSNLTSLSQQSHQREQALRDAHQAGLAWRQGDDPFSRLGRRINTTLDLRVQIELFANELRRAVAFDALSYHHQIAGRSIDWTTGSGGHHRCDYTLNLEGERFGRLSLHRNARFEESELSVVESMLSLLIHPVRNACRYEMAQQAALTDSVTGIANKRAFDKALEREASMNSRHGDRCALILCDLDHFKRVNDTHGHGVGDDVLVAVAKAMDEATRDTDTVYRIGGEEFAILLPRVESIDTIRVADRIRETIAAIRIRTDSATVSVTASAGLGLCTPNEAPGDWFQRTDDALYKAKTEGRNRTSVAVSPASPRKSPVTPLHNPTT
ncbi:diguanylate cyclase (GGDEF)-like protein [Tamilnaduibacter salinus]|uniref:diguanylate cyclase n=1 Tax=Tamilnaduibacter salinus TaxID=1484056 RepID=A0A2A2I4T5_9GAMM|nr:GGDEF domain-containing protein [Tamilnaduibacter salinus]PAV26294.1 GGDEF domain-containing protein [Tamilnaduibacter salinus]PVY78039.1 diguanylate cyclase (GGDEF)-like protein [Tamilnaduibacter salinus]